MYETKILITGITGFAGSFLAEYLLYNTNHEIYGTFLSKENIPDSIKKSSRIHLEFVDLTEKEKVGHLIQTIKPDMVYHLAALTSPEDSFNDPLKTLVNNISAQVYLLESIKEEKLKDTRILIVSSAHTYGTVEKKDLPIDENVPLRPNNPYAVSKLTQDFLGLQYFLSYGFSIIRVRAFNHIGPRQSISISISSFAKQIAEIEKGIKKPIIFVGNLQAKRDFTDVRDMVRAYSLILEKGKEGDVYNIGSGQSRTLKEVLDLLFSLSTTRIEIMVDKSLLRPTDAYELRCDGSKMEIITGWKPEISFKKTLQDILDYWRNIV